MQTEISLRQGILHDSVTKHVQIVSRGENDVMDLTQEVQRGVNETKLTSGVVTVFVSGSRGAVTTMEYEPGLVKDFPAMHSG